MAAPPFNINCFLSLSAFLGPLSGDSCGNKAWMSLFRFCGVINPPVLDKESYPFFPNRPVTATKSFVCLAPCNIHSQIPNAQSAESDKSISGTSESSIDYQCQLNVGIFYKRCQRKIKLKCATDIKQDQSLHRVNLIISTTFRRPHAKK